MRMVCVSHEKILPPSLQQGSMFGVIICNILINLNYQPCVSYIIAIIFLINIVHTRTTVTHTHTNIVARGRVYIQYIHTF